MNCKWAEGHLSACLDGTLDPAVRDEVEAHVKDCTHCGGVLDEYRHFDGLVRDLPRYEPSDELRQRIFGSPEFAAILHDMDGAAPGKRGTVISGPSPRSSAALHYDDYARGGHDRPLEALSVPASSSADDGAPTPLHPASADVSGEAADEQHGRTGAPQWMRVGLAAAAAVALLAGSGLIIKQSLGQSPAVGGRSGGISNVGQAPGQQPLAAGARVIFERSGALWSAPEHGAGLATQLTPAGVSVAPG
ncbi:MAG: anti-sigma factor family protein, partial [Ktedonobacterales bacterium]